MIKKVKIIKSVGRFFNFTARDDGLDFYKNTLLFAKNGYGKSTITSILKSFSTGNASLIKERKTLGTELRQEVVVRFNQGNLVFKDGAWATNDVETQPSFYFFDQDYIYNNVFVLEVTIDHQKRIHEAIVGDEGINLFKELGELKEAEKQAKSAFKKYSDELEVKNRNTGCQDYLNVDLKEQNTIQKKIEALNGKINAKKDITKIKVMPRFDNIEEVNLVDVDYLKSTIQKTPSSISTKLKEVVLNHFDENLHDSDDAAYFIQEGIKQKKSNNCPFCGQALNKEAELLLDAYSSYFDNSYSEIQDRIADIHDLIKERQFEAELIRLRAKVAELEKIASTWVPYMGDDFSKFSIEIDIDSAINAISPLHNDLTAELFKKVKNIKYISIISSAIQINKILTQINRSINDYNELIFKKNSYIENYIINLTSGKDLEQLEVQLALNKNLMNRFTPEECTWCLQYTEAQKSKEIAIANYENKNKELSEYSKKIFVRYENEINKLLSKMGANFTIQRLRGSSNRRIKTPFAEFRIGINNSTVGIGKSGQPEPYFANTLSAGDKNALAFAFFVAGLKIDKKLTESIVVLDDPLNSLDNSRRSKTAQIIKEISDVAKQTIILTHKRDFLYMLYDSLEKSQPLSIKADDTNGSRLIPFDIVEHRKQDHHKKIDRLRKYLDEDYGPSSDMIQQDIRILLETALKFKYYEHLSTETTLGAILGTLSSLNKLDPKVLAQCRDLNKISSPSHHGDTGPQQPLRHLERDEIIPYARDTLQVLEII